MIKKEKWKKTKVYSINLNIEVNNPYIIKSKIRIRIVYVKDQNPLYI